MRIGPFGSAEAAEWHLTIVAGVDMLKVGEERELLPVMTGRKGARHVQASACDSGRIAHFAFGPP